MMRTSILSDLSHYLDLYYFDTVCAWCKKTSYDEEHWHSVDGFLAAHTDTKFSHPMCSECYDKLLKEESVLD